MTGKPRAVFLSYASQDAAAARRLCDALRSANIEVWFDQHELRGGDAWDQRIRRQIRECALFIPLISANTAARHEGYFRLEWDLADQRTHMIARNRAFILPVAVDAAPDAGSDVPESFLRVQWTRLAGEGIPTAFVERMARLLAQDEAADGPGVPAPAPSTGIVPGAAALPGAAARYAGVFARLASRSQTVVLLAAAGMLIAGYFGAERWLFSKRAAAEAEQPAPAAPPAPPAPAPVPSAAPDKSIAVLPFVDMSEKKDQEYFSEGLSEELIDHLSQSADLKVMARTSSFQFKGRNEDVRSIAEKLGVAHLLEGSVRTAGRDMRITVQLIRASDGTHLWSQTYDRRMSDIFKVQDEIAGKVVRALNATLSGSTAFPGDEKNTEAYRSLLKGEFFYNRGSKGDYDRAIEQYRQALKLDPNYSLAWVKLGRTYVFKGQMGEIKGSEARDKAREALQRALALNPNSVAAHRWLGRLHTQYDYDLAAAKIEFDRAIALDPNGPEGRDAQQDLLMWTAFRTGKFEDIIEFAKQDVENDPLDAGSEWFLGAMQYLAGQMQDSLATRLRVLELAPTYSAAHAEAAFSWLLLGKTTEAIAAAEKETDEMSKLQALACAYWAAGRKAESDKALRQLEDKFGDVKRLRRRPGACLSRRGGCRLSVVGKSLPGPQLGNGNPQSRPLVCRPARRSALRGAAAQGEPDAVRGAQEPKPARWVHHETSRAPTRVKSGHGYVGLGTSAIRHAGGRAGRSRGVAGCAVDGVADP